VAKIRHFAIKKGPMVKGTKKKRKKEKKERDVREGGG
jgi:hypothetical protein